MPRNPRIDPPNTFLAVPPDLDPGEGISVEQSVVEISSQIQDVIRKLNGQLRIGTNVNSERSGNLDGQTLTIVFPSADTEVGHPHGLERVPEGFIVTNRDRACSVYQSDGGTWSDEMIYLKCDTASAQVQLIVF